MPYNPTPIQSKMQYRIGVGLIVVGATLLITGYLSHPFDLTMVTIGGITAAAGNLLRVFAE